MRKFSFVFLGCLWFNIEVMSTNVLYPELALDEKDSVLMNQLNSEGKGENDLLHLLQYHANVRERGFRYFMPKTADGFNLYYEKYKSKRAFCENFGHDLHVLWFQVRHNICSELKARSLDGNKLVIDRFLHHLDKFIELASANEDHTFVEYLFKDPKYCGRGLLNELWSTIISLESYVNNKSCEYKGKTREQLHTPYIVRRLDEILTRHGKNRSPSYLWNIYNGMYLTEEYKKTKAYKDMEKKIKQSFANGFTLEASRDRNE